MSLRWLAGGAIDQHSLQAAGPQAAAIQQLFWVYVALLGAVALLVAGSVVLAVLRRRTRQASPESPALSPDELPAELPARSFRRLAAQPEARRRRSVVVSTVLTAIALVGLLVESISTGNALESLSGGDALPIEVTGKQWWWQVRYLDAQPTRVFSTANELHIPVGRNVRLQLVASDVIHSFWAPNLQGKRDLIPGHDSSLVLRADRPGRYRAQCAEFCGGAHAQMSLWIVAEPPAVFEAWAAQQRKSAREPETELQHAGKLVFLRAACPACHTIQGTTAQSKVGPDLTHLASRIGLAAATYPNRRGYLGGWLLDAQALKPSNHMPNLSLAPRDLHALLAYLESLQ
ncbi:MAG TPA: cytochrome c oxidase subunit II [Polyangiales bacterium]|nr:cytochrome c oxidase subunit II [Polyangiales bacterium]